MKQTLIILLVASVLLSCGNSTQNKAIDDQKKAQKVIEASEPGRIPTKEGEWTMTAKINGKEWTASSFMPLDFQDKIHGFYKEESISLPYDRSYLKVGKKIQFGENHVALLFTNDNDGFFDGRKGEMEITKVENEWAEGKFFFTATTSSTDKTIEVTDGFFRISITGK